MPAPVLLSQYLQSKELAAEYARETTRNAQYVPEYTDAFWRCTCGSLNASAEEKCHSCGCSKELLNFALNPEALHASMVNYAAQKRAAEEKARAEQAERIRLAEEQVKLEQAKKETEIMIAARKGNQKKRRKKIIAISISLAVVLLLGCGVVIFGIPYFNYHTACNALDNGEYDAAYEVFIELGSFMDSEEMANETLYQKAEAALEDKQYDSAIQIFESLGDYKDSEGQAVEATYQKADAALKDEQYDLAIQIFESLGDYKDSADQVLESKYQKADQYQTDRDYKEAYQLFVELGGYKESRDKVLETIMFWENEALNSSSTLSARIFSRTVQITSGQFEDFYSVILLFLNEHENADFWYNWGGTDASRNVQTMLKMLPTSYQETNTLLKLFNLLAKYSGGYDVLFRENEALMRQCWSLGFVQDLAKQDDALAFFLEGYWTGSGYFMKFSKNETSGGTDSSYNLPRIQNPPGVKYFDIEDMTYYVKDGDQNHLADIFRFEIVDYDTINVYCYNNDRTYTLYR